MSFYFRKSVSAGPFRFNFSKSGVGLSVGVKGLRIGTGPRGHYVHAGRGGLYYRASLGRVGGKIKTPQFTPQIKDNYADDVVMEAIDSGDIMAMTSESHQQLLDELNANAARQKLSIILSIVFGLFGFFIGANVSSSMAFWLIFLFIPGLYLGKWFDSYRRTSVLFYDIDDNVDVAYQKLVQSFNGLLNCGGKWHIEEKGDITNYYGMKINAGASSLVRKSPTMLGFSVPAVIKSNVNPPSIMVGRQKLYFFPDVILVEDKNKFGAVPYKELMISVFDSNFIEENSVPSDAVIVRYTWRFVNKNGGPDRRFSNNRQIPVCRYEGMRLTSKNGLNELLEFSKIGVGNHFKSSICYVADCIGSQSFQ